MQDFIYIKGIKIRKLAGLRFLIDCYGKFQIYIRSPYYWKSEFDNKWRWELGELFVLVVEKLGKFEISLLYCGISIIWNLEQQYNIAELAYKRVRNLVV